MQNVLTIHQATASSVPNRKMPNNMPLTLSADENTPQINKLRVSPAA